MALQAANKGRPLALDNHNDLSASFKKFASGLAGLHPARNKAASSRLFGRLTRLRS
jgi:septum formation inhibitor-activating ATPase MinD